MWIQWEPQFLYMILFLSRLIFISPQTILRMKHEFVVYLGFPKHCLNPFFYCAIELLVSLFLREISTKSQDFIILGVEIPYIEFVQDLPAFPQTPISSLLLVPNGSSWDPSRASTFSTFLYTIIENQFYLTWRYLDGS